MRGIGLFLVMLGLLLPAGFAAADDVGESRRPCGGAGVDVLFVFDTTGSMGSTLQAAKNGAADVMSSVQQAFPAARFGVAEYRDYEGYHSYPGYATWFGNRGDAPWTLHQPFTSTHAGVQAAINGLAAGGGADGPESLTRAVYESFADPALAPGGGRERIVVAFTDAPPHDDDFNGNNYGLDPGRDAVAGTADDLDFQATVAQAQAQGLRFVAIQSGAWNAAEAPLRHLAQQTSGVYAHLGGDFADQVTDLILGLLATPYAHAEAEFVSVDLTLPVPVSYVLSRADVTGTGRAHDELFTVPLPHVGGHVTLVPADASATTTTAPVSAAARTSIADVSLLYGQVKASALVAEASAEARQGGADGHAGTALADLEVRGNAVTVTASGTHVIVVPGVGTLTVNDVATTRHGATAEAEAVLLRLDLDAPNLKGTVKVARAHAVASCEGEPGEDPTEPTPCLLDGIDRFVGSPCKEPEVPDPCGRVSTLRDVTCAEQPTPAPCLLLDPVAGAVIGCPEVPDGSGAGACRSLRVPLLCKVTDAPVRL